MARCRIVFLDAIHLALPDFPFEHTIESYTTTSPGEVAGRVRNATIAISALVPITASDLERATSLKLIAVLASGYAWVDKCYCALHNISVVYVPDASIEAVSEHFLGLYFASRRRIPTISNCVKETHLWTSYQSLRGHIWNDGPPLSCRDEVLGIIGYGRLGKSIEGLCKSLGFREVLIAERKGIEVAREGRVQFMETLRRSSVILLSCPISDDTRQMIGTAEFEIMRKEAIVVNIARGALIDEHALSCALKQRRIYGAALDVLCDEPAGPGSSPLLPEIDSRVEEVPNLIVTAHLAWYGGCTIQRLQRSNRDAIVAFWTGTLGSSAVDSSIVVHMGKIWR
ncbi:hypothetical protein AC578_10898 [Pseudocercospora eumusae]|uniref:D-isomer specific 2-hydroxyacid dehydrogenase NAD-binding domain-containing protein n=1 Tax=Pseudocercospora eumusae TaxID=321146 RepID=A0A139HFC5_9PEZI|nr:hypothetical protein AC578_10898 [Pseudocercospora eumusae]